MSTTAQTNHNVRASHAEGRKGFDTDAWKTLLNDSQRVQLRRIRAKAGREMRKHVVSLRRALNKLIEIDAEVKKQAQEAVGGQDALLEKVFGCKEPLCFDPESFSASGEPITPGFHDMLEATDDLDLQTAQLVQGGSFLLPQEDDAQ
jgi:hypothetical protein